MPLIASQIDIKLSKNRHKLVNKMLELVKKDTSKFNQNHYPSPDSITHRCDSPFCAAGFIVMAKSLPLFNRLCERKAITGSDVDWWNEAANVIGVDYAEAGVLFGTVGSWPLRFRLQYRSAATDDERYEALKARWTQWLAWSDEQLYQ